MSDPLHEQLAAVVALIKAVVGQDIVGIYLYGSAVVGGMRPGSDVDLFVVSRRRTTRPEQRRLVDMLSPVSARRQRPASWHPVELTIVVQSEVRPWRYPPRTDFQFGEWLRREYDAGTLGSSTPLNPDLAVLISMVLLADRPLLGACPAEVLPAVPFVDLTRAMLSGIHGLLEDLDSDTTNVVLTLARIWSTSATGGIHSKDAAADWALARLPQEHRGVVARARGSTSATRTSAGTISDRVFGRMPNTSCARSSASRSHATVSTMSCPASASGDDPRHERGDWHWHLRHLAESAVEPRPTAELTSQRSRIVAEGPFWPDATAPDG